MNRHWHLPVPQSNPSFQIRLLVSLQAVHLLSDHWFCPQLPESRSQHLQRLSQNNVPIEACINKNLNIAYTYTVPLLLLILLGPLVHYSIAAAAAAVAAVAANTHLYSANGSKQEKKEKDLN